MLLQNNNKYFSVQFKNLVRNKPKINGFGQFDANKH